MDIPSISFFSQFTKNIQKTNSIMINDNKKHCYMSSEDETS